jgi:hypothetical protein
VRIVRILGVAMLVALAASCVGASPEASSPGGEAGRTVEAVTPPLVTARLLLPSSTMAQGSTMRGTVVVDNQSGTVARYQGGCGSPFQVVLDRPDYEPLYLSSPCAGLHTFPVGESRYPVSVTAAEHLWLGNWKATLVELGESIPAPPLTVRVTRPPST